MNQPNLKSRLKLASERRMLPKQIETIQRMVAQFFLVDFDGIKAPSGTNGARAAIKTWPRQVAMFLCRMETPITLVEIGQHFGDRDHGTVAWAVKVVNEVCDSYPDVRAEIAVIRNRVQKELELMRKESV